MLFLVFNRPSETAKVFDSIRRARPSRLYVAADGPREGRPDEDERVAMVRKIATSVDWPCELKTLFRQKNLGCKYAVSDAITWFFDQEDQGIVLEDDCLPSQSFFWFCQEMLETRKDDDAVMAITGTNIRADIDSKASYCFSKYPLMWGWASWASAWRKYDLNMSGWPELDQSSFLSGLEIGGGRFIATWRNIFQRTYDGEIDTWDYQWIYSCWVNGGLTVAPSRNLITNIGFSDDATHTKNLHPILSNLKSDELIWPLVHRSEYEIYPELDRYISKYWFGASWISFAKSLLMRVPGAIPLNRYRRRALRFFGT